MEFITLKVPVTDFTALINFLGEIPSRFGVYPIYMDFQRQAAEQEQEHRGEVDQKQEAAYQTELGKQNAE